MPNDQDDERLLTTWLDDYVYRQSGSVSQHDEQSEQVTPHPVSWIEEHFIDPVTSNLIELQPHQKRILRKALQMDDNGRSRYSLVVWSEPKKSGKTAIAGAVGTYVACNIEAPNEISCLANDQEQSAGRIFAAMIPTLEALGWKVPPTLSGQKQNPFMYHPEIQTVVKAITTDYKKQAGGNQGLSLWSELWAYKGERLTRLWEEMTPPPTRKFSMRWVETYAGFKGENLLLQNIYSRVFKDFEEIELQPGVVKPWPDLPVYELDGGTTLVYWSHDHRMPWQTEAYYVAQRIDLRPMAFIRLHTNWWVESAELFITDDMWKLSIRQLPEEGKGFTFAIDVSKNGDTTALTGSKRIGDLVHTAYVDTWEPEPGQEVPYADMETRIVELWKSGILKPPLWYDPYQMVYLAQRLRSKGLACKEFGQAGPRLRSDTFLYVMYRDGKIINVANPRLRQHVLAATAKETGEKLKIVPAKEERVIRIIKPDEGQESLRKVDCAVAQSMSVYAAWHSKDGGWGSSGV